jgi:hypothetical protein
MSPSPVRARTRVRLPGLGHLRMPLVPALLLIVSGGLLAGCGASTGGSSGGGGGGGSANLITHEEMEQAAVSNAYDAVQRLRPRWMQSRGSRSTQGDTQIVVAVNGTYFGGLDSLRQFSIDELDGLRYLDSGTAASAVRGVGPGVHVEAAVLVELRGSGG